MNNNSKYNNGGISYYMGGGYVPGYANGGTSGFSIDPSSLLNMNPETPTMTPGSVINSSPINIPNTFQGDARGIADIIAGNMNPNTNNVMDPNFKFDPSDVEYNEKNPYDTNKSAYDNYMDATRTPEDDAREDLQIAVEQEKKDIFKNKMGKIGELLDVYGASKDGIGSQSTAGGFIKVGTGASRVPQTRRFEEGGIVSMMPMGMYQGGGVNPFLDGFEFDFDYDDYMDMINGIYDNPANTITRDDALARGYGAPQDDRIAEGIDPSKLNYEDTPSNILPGADIRINARDENPAAYKFYPSEVSKLYAQMKGVPFSPLVAPPKESTFVDELGLYDESGNIAPQRRIQSQLYAKNGTYVNAYADGTGRYGAQQLEPNQFPRRQELITGPGGERGDKIPAMLSDGEFVTNSAAVRGMGIMAGANPQDEYEQRLLGARQMYDYQKQAEEMAKRYA
jgi:hypothetical protein